MTNEKSQTDTKEQDDCEGHMETNASSIIWFNLQTLNKMMQVGLAAKRLSIKGCKLLLWD